MLWWLWTVVAVCGARAVVVSVCVVYLEIIVSSVKKRKKKIPEARDAE